MRTASRPATRTARRCTTSPRSAFLAPPLLIALSALAMLAARGDRWRLRRARGEPRVVASSFKLPDLGEGLTEGEVARWLVAEGQEIAEDDPLVEIQTDKATVEIPSPYAGTVLRILVPEGEIAPVGTELVLIGEPGEETPSSSPLEASTAPAQARVLQATVVARNGGSAASERVQATPVVRRIAQELGVDLAGVTGSGPEGASSRTTSVPPPAECPTADASRSAVFVV